MWLIDTGRGVVLLSQSESGSVLEDWEHDDDLVYYCGDSYGMTDSSNVHRISRLQLNLFLLEDAQWIAIILTLLDWHSSSISLKLVCLIPQGLDFGGLDVTFR